MSDEIQETNMARFHLAASAWQSDAALTGDEARHLSQVLRMKVGEEISVFDGEGRRARAEILGISRERVTLRIGEIQVSRPPLPQILLAQAIPKGKNMDLIVQKAVELGIASIQPLVTRNTVVQPGEGKSVKWRRNAMEACKQCGQDRVPEIGEPQNFETWLAAQTGDGSLKLMASLAEGAMPLRAVLRSHPGTSAATWLVGPEGDFTAQETAAALAAGFLPVSLGEIVLRVETATLYGLSALRYEFSELAEG